MPLPVNPGSFPNICAEMAYLPRSPRVFPADIQHDFRDYMYDVRLATLADWVGEGTRLYLRAADILRRRRVDPIAIALDMDEVFDARTIFVAHDHLAAFWRNGQMHEVMAGGYRKYWGRPPDELYCNNRSPGELIAIFRQWLRWQTNDWADRKPDLLELFLLAILGEHTRTGQAVSAEFYFTVATLYQVPGVTVPKPLPVPSAP